MFNNKILYKVAILSTLLLTFAILSDGGNLVQAKPPGGMGAPSNNVTALNVYDNSTMVLEFGNGTTLASPYSNVWTISFLPAGNQTLGNIPPGIGAVPPGGIGATTPPPGGAAVPPGIVTITTPTMIPSNVTALNVYDNSTMVLEFGNGTTLASPYSNVWTISFLPAGNQTLGDIPAGIGAVPPPGAGAVPPPGAGAVPPPGAGAVPPPGAGAVMPPGGIGAPSNNVTALNLYYISTMVL